MNETSAPCRAAISEMKATGLDAAPSRLVKPPRVAASPCALECKWLQTVRLNDIDGTAARPLRGVRPGGRRPYRRPLHQERPARHRRHEADRALRLPRIFGGRTECFTMTRPKARRLSAAAQVRLHTARRFASSRSGTPFTITARSPCIAAARRDHRGRRRARLIFEGAEPRPNGDRGAEATSDAPMRTPARPTIGLALGGGAARGFAHIGVIRTLLAHGIVPDIIVGTSIGAVVGGCYAAGQLDDIEDWARSLTRRSILGYLDVSLAGVRPDRRRQARRHGSTKRSATRRSTSCRCALPRSPPRSAPATRSG